MQGVDTAAREYRRTPRPASNELFSWPDRARACIATPQIGPEITIILVLPLVNSFRGSPIPARGAPGRALGELGWTSDGAGKPKFSARPSTKDE